MRILKLLFLLIISGSSSALAQKVFQLAPPVVKYKSVFYDTAVTVAMEFRHPGSEIRYTTGKDGIDITSPLYTSPLRFSGGIIQFSARSMAEGYNDSDPVKLLFMPAGLPIQKLVATQPSAKYPGNGPSALNDLQGGIASASAPYWLGYTSDTIQVTAELGKVQTVRQVMLQFLVNEGSWIFLPDQIQLELWDETQQQYRLAVTRGYDHSSTRNKPGCYPEFLTLKEPVTTGRLRLTVLAVRQMPLWHEAKGEHAWVFIDELKIY